MCLRNILSTAVPSHHEQRQSAGRSETRSLLPLERPENRDIMQRRRSLNRKEVCVSIVIGQTRTCKFNTRRSELVGLKCLLRGQWHRVCLCERLRECVFNSKVKSDNFNTSEITSTQRETELSSSTSGCVCFGAGLTLAAGISHLIHD